MAGINFKSKTSIDQEREYLQKARDNVLEKAKSKYDREERRRQEAAARGEDRWMLPAITDRIQSDSKTAEKAKRKQKKEKKKLKKEKKKKKKKHVSSDSDSDSGSDSDDQWVEKSSSVSAAPKESVRPVMGPTLQRDSWMEEAGLFDIPSTSRKEIRERQMRIKEEKNAEISKEKEAARMKIELNPYWQNGGTGLPEENPSKSKAKSNHSGVGDGGLSWLLKSFERCKQQAAEEGRSLEEMAAERWGSLKKFEKMLADAEKKERRQSKRGPSPPRWKKERSRSPTRSSRRSSRSPRRSRSRSPNRARKRSYSRSPEKQSYRSRSPSSKHGRSSQTDHSKDGRNFMKPGDSTRDRRSDDSAPRRTFMKPGESRSDDSRSRSFMRPDDSRSNSDSSRSRTFMRPDDGGDSRSKGDSKRFMRPSENQDEEPRNQRQFVQPADDNSRRHSRESNNHQSSRSDHRSSNDVPRWKKKGYEKPNDSQSSREEETRSRSHRDSRDYGRSRKRSWSYSSSSTDSSSSSSSSESEADTAPSSEEVEATPAVEILSPQELNALGAKILKAEIMGNNALAEELKAKLDAARKVIEENPQLAAKHEKQGQGEPEEVVLTRTTRGGLVQPLPDAKHDRETGGKRRRKKNVQTHGGGGERERYFDDDDQHSLKSLVEREKMGTAEDQNAMFARLAGRAAEKTDEDFQVDDVFISKAARKQSEAQNEEKDRARSIMEHKKMATAMEKCRFCFDKVPKHLIIAIGLKVYLCLPNHRSLTPGHCLIVPMQHVTAGTVVDEDVWQEVQTFRKCLVRMFESQDQDVVFMETSMHQKYLPHMSMECIPMEKETGDLAPIYFKKAIQDAGPEWSNNKKLVDLSCKDIRHSIPKGFPYFSVDFGLQGGFAHVIEDEQTFPSYFGREIVGGMVDAEPGLWRKPHKESFDVQRKKVLEFSAWWKPFDWTLDLQAND
ncbi:CWF19-like protein 2 [Haliotis rubra]|uniref:CWF19-like protein 2 n=1 Tax=Haliotis rubra TaxID=36100 RepID=UPI001EE605B8|nr:CWF19-like protein 2 [Haliotis rubra]